MILSKKKKDFKRYVELWEKELSVIYNLVSINYCVKKGSEPLNSPHLLSPIKLLCRWVVKILFKKKVK